MSLPNCSLPMPRHHVHDTNPEPPFDFVAFLSQVRHVDREAAGLLMSNWIERHAPLRLRQIDVLSG